MNGRCSTLCLAAILLPAAAPAAGYVPLPLIPKSSIPEDMPKDIRHQVERLYTRNEKETVAAANALGRMGKDAAIAAPFLAAMLHDEVRHGNTGWSAARALMAIGKPALEPTILAFQFGNRYARMRAFRVFMELKDPQTIPFLISAAVDGLSASGGDARKTLAVIGQPALDYIVEAIKNPNAEIRRGAVLSITAFPSKNAVKLLSERLTDDNALVRYEARRALLELFRNDPKLRVPLNDNLRGLLKDPDPDTRRDGIKLVVYIDDPTKIDEIHRLTKDADIKVRRTAIETIGWIKTDRAAAVLLELLKSPEPWVRTTVAQALARQKRKEAIPSITAMLDDDSAAIREKAVDALIAFGTETTPALLKASVDPDPIVRAKVVSALRRTRDTRCLKRLTALLDDKDRGVRMESTVALVLYYTGTLRLPKRHEERLPANEAVPLYNKSVRTALLKTLDDDNVVARQKAIEALLDSRAPSDPEAAIAAINNSDAGVRQSGLRYIARMKKIPNIERIRELAKDKDHRVRGVAIGVLGRAKDQESYDLFVAALKDWRDVACSAIEALRHFGAKAIPHIANSLRASDSRVRERAARTLVAMNHPEARKVLAEALESNHYGMRTAAAAALGREVRNVRSPKVLVELLERNPKDERGEIRRELTERGSESIPAIAGLLTNRNQTVRVAAIGILGGFQERAAADALLLATRDPDPPVKAAAIAALARAGDKRVVPIAADALGSNNTSVRETATAALGRLETGASLGPLMKSLNHADWHMRWLAADGLGKLKDPRARDALVAALSDEHWYVRRAATQALGALGDKTTVAALMDNIEDEHWYVQRSTRIAIWRITGRHFGTDPAKWKEWWENGMPPEGGTPAPGTTKPKCRKKHPPLLPE